MTTGATVILGFVISLVLWYCQSFLVNYRKAAASGFTLLLCPVDPQSVLWIVFSVQLRGALEKYLPALVFERIKCAIYGWEFIYRFEVFQKLGSNFLLTSPGKNELWIADPEVAQAVLSRRNDFTPQEVAKQIIGRFGPNLITAEGDDWMRQRKVIAPLLNERISELTWNETTRQTQQMMQAFMAEDNRLAPEEARPANTPNGVLNVVRAIRNIAINVIGAVAYGAQRSWDQSISQVPEGYHLSYMESMLSIVENLIPSTMVSPTLMKLPFWPKGVQRLGIASDEFPRHAQDLIKGERESGPAERINFMSTIIQLSDSEARADTKVLKNRLFLTEPELTGNIFQFTVAGFDTTANTMVYAILLLALYPKWQDWINAEIQQSAIAVGSLDYSKMYCRLQRCLALMFEVLRLYTPVLHVARSARHAQEIPTKRKTYKVPAGTTIYVSAACIHVNPGIWGSDALSFRPTRWIDSSIQPPTLISPSQCTFLPWSGGSRVCPGMKMAQVEFVAAMMTIFIKYKVSPAIREGETVESARRRLEGIITDSQPQVTLQVRRPLDVELQWEGR